MRSRPPPGRHSAKRYRSRSAGAALPPKSPVGSCGAGLRAGHAKPPGAASLGPPCEATSPRGPSPERPPGRGLWCPARGPDPQGRGSWPARPWRTRRRNLASSGEAPPPAPRPTGPGPPRAVRTRPALARWSPGAAPSSGPRPHAASVALGVPVHLKLGRHVLQVGQTGESRGELRNTIPDRLGSPRPASWVPGSADPAFDPPVAPLRYGPVVPSGSPGPFVSARALSCSPDHAQIQPSLNAATLAHPCRRVRYGV